MQRGATLLWDGPDSSGRLGQTEFGQSEIRNTGSDTLSPRSMQAAPTLPGRQNQRHRPSDGDRPGGIRERANGFLLPESSPVSNGLVEFTSVLLGERLRRRRLRILPPGEKEAANAPESGPPSNLEQPSPHTSPKLAPAFPP
jgi:hypothetical protein